MSDWQARLRASGHRLTPQRELVLAAVETLGHATPDEVFADMFDGDETTDVPMTEMNYRPRIHVDLPGEYRPDGFPNTAGALADLIEADLEKVGTCL